MRKLTGGLYTFLPLGLRALRKVEQIVREEMDHAGALELLMPALQPPEIWQKSGRYETMKDVLWLPAQALFESDGRTFVYAQTPEGGFATSDVKLVRRSESQVVVTGAKEGQKVARARPDQKKDKDKEKKAGSAVQAISN